jgi:hypothetical protein
MVRVCYVGYKLQVTPEKVHLRPRGIIFSSDLQNITHEWHTKFIQQLQQLQINVNVTQQ